MQPAGATFSGHAGATVQAFDVIVIGGGITGLSAIYHLQSAGIGRIALASGTADAATSRHSAGFLAGGQIDNFTRISHAYGDALAARLWRFGDLAFDELAAFCEANAVPLKRGRRQRLITSAAEQVEAEKAVALMQGQGLPSTLKSPGGDLTARVISVQDDGPRSAAVDVWQLMHALEDATAGAPRLSRVKHLELLHNGAELTLDDDQMARAEIVVVAAHIGTSLLIPDLRDALVPYADQYSEIQLAKGQISWTGSTFSANHTYEWGIFTAPDVVRLGGGRYLRPMAGIEATAASIDPKITAHLLGQLGKTFTFGEGAKVLMTSAGREIRPCDELPVVGPMYGNGRALIATGFMGAGLTQGFLAGRCVAELIKDGCSDILPRELWPERLRTLER